MTTRFLATLVLGISLANPASADDVAPDKLVDALNGIFGKYAKTRASHSKGQCVKGTFTPDAGAPAVSKAAFLAAPVPILGRFSFGGGNPQASDKEKSPRGLAVRFDPNGPAQNDFVFLSAPIFFARSAGEALEFLSVREGAAAGKLDKARVKAFTDAHPWTAKQGAWVAAKPVPASYAGLPYFSIHAFEATAADGTKTPVKFKFEPAAGELGLTDDEAKAKEEGFFTAELDQRLKGGPIEFSLVAVVGTASDAVDDPTVEWPEAERKKIPLGKLSITGPEANETCDASTFDPTNLADGLAGYPGDSVLPARSGAYAVSLTRRSE
jgi:catalase